jgi:hypothetical protein
MVCEKAVGEYNGASLNSMFEFLDRIKGVLNPYGKRQWKICCLHKLAKFPLLYEKGPCPVLSSSSELFRPLLP